MIISLVGLGANPRANILPHRFYAISFGWIGCQPNLPNFYGQLGFIRTGAGTRFLWSVWFYWDRYRYPIFVVGWVLLRLVQVPYLDGRLGWTTIPH